MKISYELYLARVNFIITRLKPLKMLDETIERNGIVTVSEAQVDRYDPVLFLYFKNADYASLFIEVSENYDIIHSSHRVSAKMAAPSLDTGHERAYSKENLDVLFTELSSKLIPLMQEHIARKIRRLDTLDLNFKSVILGHIHDKKASLKDMHEVEQVIDVTNSIIQLIDNALSEDNEKINAIISSETEAEQLKLGV